MKSLRTYNMDKSSIAILNSKLNKSKFVNRAIHKLHNNQLGFDISDVSDRELWLEILYRMDVNDPLRPLIKANIPRES